MARSICVFSSSSDAIDNGHFEVALELGREIGRRGDSLVFGGSGVGLMHEVARGVHESGGRVVGVIPSFMDERGIGYRNCAEMIVTSTMRERKAEMEARADAFVALPGGFGTLEEVLEIITLKQLQQHTKPVVFVNHDNFYEPLRMLFEHMYEQRFAKSAYRSMYHFAADVPSVFAYFDSYTPPKLESKWFDTTEI